MSDGHIKKLEEQQKLEEQLANEVKEAHGVGRSGGQRKPDGINLPDEIALRCDRLKAIAGAKTKIEARAKERFEQAQADYQAKINKREEKSKESGQAPRGKAPVPPVEGAQDSEKLLAGHPKDPINLTPEKLMVGHPDEESRIMKVSDGGFDPCYNSQIAVDMDSMLIVTTNTVQACNDKQQVEPILEQLGALPVKLGKPGNLVADTGYF